MKEKTIKEAMSNGVFSHFITSILNKREISEYGKILLRDIKIEPELNSAKSSIMVYMITIIDTIRFK